MLINDASDATPDVVSAIRPSVPRSIPAEEVYREQVLMAGYDLLSTLNDITFHNSGESLQFEITQYGFAFTVENLTGIAERALQVATAALEQLRQAGARQDWLASGWPKRCANCGNRIDVELDEWQICRDQPEHTWCHRFNATSTEADEDSDRAAMIEDDEHAAYCEDRMRTGGPRHDDLVELIFPDSRTVEGTWYVPGPAPLAAPIVLDWNDAEVTTAGAQVRVIDVGDGTSDIWVPSLQDLARGQELIAAFGAAPGPDSSSLPGESESSC